MVPRAHGGTDGILRWSRIPADSENENAGRCYNYFCWASKAIATGLFDSDRDVRRIGIWTLEVIMISERPLLRHLTAAGLSARFLSLLQEGEERLQRHPQCVKDQHLPGEFYRRIPEEL